MYVPGNTVIMALSRMVCPSPFFPVLIGRFRLTRRAGPVRGTGEKISPNEVSLARKPMLLACVFTAPHTIPQTINESPTMYEYFVKYGWVIFQKENIVL